MRTDRMRSDRPAPRRASRALVAGALAATALLAWWIARHRATGSGHEKSTTVRAEFGRGLVPIRRLADGRWAAAPFAWTRPGARDGLVHVRGTVRDASDRSGVGDVAVVLSGAGGESETTTAADGRYEIAVPAGAYRAFVRGD